MVTGAPPYKELKGEGSVGAQAEEAWQYARSRSTSIISDVFAGQFQSTLQCPVCGASSHTFDEFLDVSLELPEQLVKGSTITLQVKYTCGHTSTMMCVHCCISELACGNVSN